MNPANCKFACGGECGIGAVGTASAVGLRHWAVVSGTAPTITAAPSGMTSAKAIRFNPSAASSALRHDYLTAIASPATSVWRFDVYFASMPAASCDISRVGSGHGVYYDQASGTLRAGESAAALASAGIAVTTGIVYTVDVKVVSGTTPTVDMRVNGTAATQYSAAGSAAAHSNIQIGIGGVNTTADFYIDNLVTSGTAAEYPIGSGITIGLYPNADRTNSAATPTDGNKGHLFSATNDFGKGSGGATATGAQNAEATSWQSLANPLSVNIGTNFISDLLGASTEHMVWELADLPAGVTTVNGVMLVCTTHSASATANVFNAGIGNASAQVALVNGNAASTTIIVCHVLRTTDASGAAWTPTLVNATTVYFGDSTDVNPDPYLDGICLEVDYVPSANVNVSVNAVAATGSVRAVTISIPQTVAPGTVAATGSVRTVAIQVGAIPATVAATGTVQSVTIAATAIVTPLAVAATATVRSVTISMPMTVSPTTVAGVSTVQAVTVVTGSSTTVAVTTVAAIATIPALGFVASTWGTVLGEYDFSKTALITSSGGSTSSVAPTSGSSGAIAQATPAKQPITGTRVAPNGQNCLDFGGGQNLQVTVSHSGSLTFAVVAAVDVASGSMELIGDGDSIYFSGGSSPVWQVYGSSNFNTGVLVNTAWHVFLVTHDGANGAVNFWVDGVNQGAGNCGAPSLFVLSVGDYYGGGYPTDGGIAHALWWDGVIVDPAGASASLMAKWFISPPSPDVTVSVARVAAVGTVQPLTVTAPITVSPSPVAGVATVQTVVIQAGSSTTVPVSAVVSTALVRSVTILSDTKVLVTQVAAVGTVQLLGVGLAPVVLAVQATAVVQSVSILTTAAAAPAKVSAVAIVQTVVISAAPIVAANVAAGVATMPAVAIAFGSAVVASPVAAITTVQAVGVQTSGTTTILVATVSAVAIVRSVGISATSALTPTVVAAATTVQSVSIKTTALIVVGPVAAVATVRGTTVLVSTPTTVSVLRVQAVSTVNTVTITIAAITLPLVEAISAPHMLSGWSARSMLEGWTASRLEFEERADLVGLSS